MDMSAAATRHAFHAQSLPPYRLLNGDPPSLVPRPPQPGAVARRQGKRARGQLLRVYSGGRPCEPVCLQTQSLPGLHYSVGSGRPPYRLKPTHPFAALQSKFGGRWQLRTNITVQDVRGWAVGGAALRF